MTEAGLSAAPKLVLVALVLRGRIEITAFLALVAVAARAARR